MTSNKPNLLFSFLIILIAIGIAAAVTGVYVVNKPSHEAAAFENYHEFDRNEIKVEETKSTLYGSTYAFTSRETRLSQLLHRQREGFLLEN